MSLTSTLTRPSTVREVLLDALRGAADFNSADLIAPVAVLWPDGDRAWSGVARAVATDLTVLTLGEYDPDRRQGPVPWLRIEADRLRAEKALGGTTVIYLPGIARKHLVNFAEMSGEIQPLAGLVVQSAIFSQRNGSDWTPTAFLTNESVGVGLSLTASRQTREALGRSLVRLLDVRVADMHGRTLDSTDFDALLVNDPSRQLLLWLSNPEAFKATLENDSTWKGFVSFVLKQFKVDLVRDGELVAAQRLGDREGKWADVWNRFADAPQAYPGVVDALRRSRSNATMMPLHLDSWPQDNEQAEAFALAEVHALAGKPAAQMRAGIAELDRDHSARLETVWAKLNQTPAAALVGRLAALVRLTASAGAAGDVAAQAGHYAQEGWQADRAFLAALASLELGHEGSSAVEKVAESIYRPWLEAVVSGFQAAWISAPPEAPWARVGPEEPEGTCVLFVDGLRFDVAAELAQALSVRGLTTNLGWGLAGVPTVTATCKPSISPIAGDLVAGPQLGPQRHGGSVLTQDALKKALADRDWSFTAPDDVGNPTGRTWTEGGDIDTLGHNLGVKLAHHLPDQVRALSTRTTELLNAGWSRVRIVTDHGWLLMPSGLPKHHLPEHLTVVRKGRCARMTAGTTTPPGVGQLPWRWDSDVQIALAPGIHAFEAGKVYEHGGLSPQESVVPHLVVSKPGVPVTSSLTVDLSWSGLRLKIEVAHAPDGCSADLRTKPADPVTSLASAVKKLRGNKATLLANDEHQGEAAVLVVLSPQGKLLASQPTQIPEG